MNSLRRGLCLVPLSLLVINNFIMCGGWIFWTEFVSLYLNCLLKFYKSNGRVCTRKILISQRVKAEFHWKFHETPIKFNSESVEPFFFSNKHTLELALRGKELEKVILWCDHVFFRDWKESHNSCAGARRSNKSEQWWWVLILRGRAACRFYGCNSWNPLDCSPPASSVQGILQARILE